MERTWHLMHKSSRPLHYLLAHTQTHTHTHSRKNTRQESSVDTSQEKLGENCDSRM